MHLLPTYIELVVEQSSSLITLSKMWILTIGRRRYAMIFCLLLLGYVSTRISVTIDMPIQLLHATATPRCSKLYHR
jgi:uncharacterized protein with PQ loop repeat